jgi:outer membrane protein assembly factor BamD (BamD/ComL family)
MIRTVSILVSFLLLLCGLLLAAQSRPAQRPGLIRDTGVAEAPDNAPAVKEPNPLLCEDNIRIGNFYFKKRNYVAAIRRYLEAIEYQSNSVRAFDALARAYQKNEEPAKAMAAYRKFIKENPDSPNSSEFRAKLEKLEKSTR